MMVGVLVAVFTLAFAVRLGLTVQFVGLAAPPDGAANPDQLDYEMFAWQLAQGHGYGYSADRPSATRLPGTSWTILPVYLTFGRDFAMARLTIIALSAATCALVALIVGRSFGLLAGGLAGLALAGTPEHAYYAMHLLSESPFGFWLVVTVGLAIEALRRKDWRWDVAVGLALGMAVYCRPQAMFMVPIAWGLWLLAGRRTWRTHWQRVALPTVVMLACLLPWMVRNQVVIGKFGLSTIVCQGIWGSHNPVTFSDLAVAGSWIPTSSLDDQFPLSHDEVERERQSLAYAKAAIRENWRLLPYLEWMKLRSFLLPSDPSGAKNRLLVASFAVSWSVMGPLAAVGLVVAWRRNRRAAVVFVSAVAGTVLMVLVFYGLKRFRHAMAPVYVPLAMLTVTEVLRLAWLQSRALLERRGGSSRLHYPPSTAPSA